MLCSYSFIALIINHMTVDIQTNNFLCYHTNIRFDIICKSVIL